MGARCSRMERGLGFKFIFIHSYAFLYTNMLVYFLNCFFVFCMTPWSNWGPFFSPDQKADFGHFWLVAKIAVNFWADQIQTTLIIIRSDTVRICFRPYIYYPISYL